MTTEEKLRTTLWTRLLAVSKIDYNDLEEYETLFEEILSITPQNEITELLQWYFYREHNKKWSIHGLRFPALTGNREYSVVLAKSLPIKDPKYLDGSLKYTDSKKKLDYSGSLDFVSLQKLISVAGEETDIKNAIDQLFMSNLLQRVFIGDIVWLYFYEQMGVFKMLGVILDDYSTKGKFPIAYSRNTSTILERLVRFTKAGISSTVRERESAYRRCLGWKSEAGKSLDIDIRSNNAFQSLFEKFIKSSLEYYDSKRLASAIQGTTPSSKPSAATLTTISETIELLEQTFRQFEYGQNHSIVLKGIIWTIIGLGLIRDIKSQLGVPASYTKPAEYFASTYDILIHNQQSSDTETNRYTLHKQCAENGRDILLSLNKLDFKNTSPNGELETWLELMETRIEAYRTAYRTLTKIDLGIKEVSVKT